MRISNGASNFAREASGWLLIAAVVFVTIYYFADLRGLSRTYIGSTAEQSDVAEPAQLQTPPSGSEREVHLQAADSGHFFSDVDINGRTVNVVVDTGATAVSLSYEDARAIGIRLTDDEFTMESRTANGTAKIAPVMLDRIRIGDIEIRDVEAFVAEPGKLFQTLLGMSFLRRLSQIDIRGRELVLVQ